MCRRRRIGIPQRAPRNPSTVGASSITNIPAIEVFDGGLSSLHGHIGLLMDARQISAGISSHALGEPDAVFDEQGPEATLSFMSDQFVDADYGTEVVFVSTAGSITFYSFGSSSGAAIDGELSATLSGEQVVGMDAYGGPIVRSVSGTLTATFAVHLE